MDLPLLLLREDIGENYDAAVRAAAAAVAAEACHLALYDPLSQELISRRGRGSAGEAAPQYRFPLDSSPASALVVRTQAPHISNDPANDPLYGEGVVESGVQSIMTVPLMREERLIGLVYALNKPGGFSAEDGRVLLAAAASLAVTLESIRLYAEERDRRVFNESLLEVARALIATPTEEAALGAVLDQLWRVLRYQAAAALVLEGDVVRVAAARGADEAKVVLLKASPELSSLLESRKAGVLARPAELAAQLGFRAAPGMAVVAPLVSKRALLGALVAAFDAEQFKEAHETPLLSSFADQVALFLDTGRNLRRERQARGRAAAGARVTRMVATRVDADSILKVAASELLALSGVDRCILYLGHARNPVLIPVANAGTLPEEEARVRELRVDLTSPRMAPLTEKREPLAFQGEAAPPPDIVAFPGARALLFLPMVSRDVIMGAVALYSVGQHRTFDPVQIEFLNDVAQQIALALENARLFQAMSQMATTDELTRIANRRKFMEAFHLELQKARRTGQPLALILCDVDHLKKINDSFGHAAGDATIRHVADALRLDRSESDLPARLGGEEFAVILPSTDILAAARAAEQMCATLASTPIATVGNVTASFGVATFPDDGVEAKDLMKTADERLYSAKAAGRNQVCYVTMAKSVPESTTSSLKKVEMPDDLLPDDV
jgi:diguanylate cyclase (GGDEF)-like protein